MVKSLVTQLSQQCIRIPPLLDSLFGSSNNGQRQPSTEGLLGVLRQMSEDFPATYIILDALDECDDQEALMATIETIAGWQLESLHSIVTSRKVRDIQSSLESLVDKCNIVPLERKVVDEDIRKYVNHRMSVDMKLRKWQGGEMQAEIEAALMKGAHGMYATVPSMISKLTDSITRFRWAVCQLDSLGTCLNRAMLRKSLKSLPRTLDETYERVLCAIDEDQSIYALRLLRWLAFSSRPLSLEEVSEVVAIDPESRHVLDKDEVLEDPLDALNICASLLTLQDEVETGYESDDETEELKGNGIITFAHYSVKEYLTSERIQKGAASIFSLQESTSNITLANSCIRYLLQFQDAESFCKETVKAHKLARYSAEFWIRHARSSEDTTTHALIMELFSSHDGAYLHWIRMHDLDPSPWARRSYNMSKEAHEIPLPLYYASLAGLTIIVSYLVVDKGADVNAQGGY